MTDIQDEPPVQKEPRQAEGERSRPPIPSPPTPSAPACSEASRFRPPIKPLAPRARPSPDRVPPPRRELPLPSVKGVSRTEIIPVRLTPRRLARLEATRGRWALPPLLRLPIFHGLLTFFCLAFLPQHPLSIPIALGLSSVIVFYIHVLANCLGYRLQSQ